MRVSVLMPPAGGYWVNPDCHHLLGLLGLKPQVGGVGRLRGSGPLTPAGPGTGSAVAADALTWW